MTNEEAIDELSVLWERSRVAKEQGYLLLADGNYQDALDMAIEALKKSSWMPITHREMTEEEKEFFNVEFEDTKILDCNLPDDGEEVLITTEFRNVFMDVFHNENGDCYFEDYEIEDARAWMPLPKPYKREAEA